LKVRVGRQQMGFDLQRFVGVRDGPNVRQSFDAVWADWERSPWRLITFWSHPVQNLPEKPFDDSSSGGLQYGGFRVERNDIGPGKLSAYYSRYEADSAHYLDGGGRSVATIWTCAIRLSAVRSIGTSKVCGRPVESVASRLEPGPWDRSADTRLSAFVGVRASGCSSIWPPAIDDAEMERSEPSIRCFPTRYYFTLMSTPTYANLIHLRPSLELRPVQNLKLIARVGLQWRQTTEDAVYVIPNRPVAGTAGMPGRWTGIYEQLRAEMADQSELGRRSRRGPVPGGDVIRRAGGINANYVNVELRFGW